jgi:hypothetical protein
MGFFGNDAINRVNLHYGLQQLAQGAGGVFLLVYLLRAGVPTPLVFCALAGMVGGRFLIRPLVLPFARRFGIRATLILGTVLEAAVFPLLPYVHGPDAWFIAVILVTPFGSVLYWTSFHAYFAALGDAEHRGSQLGAREALAAVIGIVAPLLGGWALVTMGPKFAFLCVAGLQVLAAAPLLGAPRVPVAQEAPGGFRAAMLGAFLLSTDGWFAACYYYVWQIALFVTLGESFAAYGGAMALAGLVGAAASLGVGRLIDLGHGRRSVAAAYSLGAGVVILRAAGYGVPWLAVTANALGAVAAALLVPVLMARVYNLSKASPCPLRFHIATEGGWDIGCGLGCLSAAALTWAGAPMWTAIILALVGGAAAFATLMRSYAAAATAAIAYEK